MSPLKVAFQSLLPIFMIGDGVLKTVSVRPTGMYGELDVNLIAMMIRRAASRGGVAIIVGPKNGEVRFKVSCSFCFCESFRS